MTKKPSKPRLPPRLPSMHQESLTNEFVSCYAADHQFVSELQSLVGKHPATILALLIEKNPDVLARLANGHDIRPPLYPTWLEIELDLCGVTKQLKMESGAGEEPTWETIQAFRDDLDGLVKRWNLHILPGHGGHDATLGACLLLAAHHDRPDDAASVYMAVNGTHDVKFEAGDVLSTGRGRGFTITTSAFYNPRAQRELDGNGDPIPVRKLLLDELAAQLDAELASINEGMAEAGYVYPRDSEEQHKYMRWLYRRIAYREPVDLIAFHPLKPDEPRATRRYVEEATRKLASALGIHRIPPGTTF